MEDVPYEERLPARVISHRAKTTPDKVVVLLPKGDALEDAFFELTYRELDHAVDTVAYWLDDVLSGGVKLQYESEIQWPTIVYAGSNDYRYVLLSYAMAKTHRKLMITLPTNTKEGLVKLLNAQGVKTALASGDQVSSMEDAMNLIPGGRLLEMPPLSSLLGVTPRIKYSCSLQWSEIKNHTWIVMQSSGTTGEPKPIKQTNTALDAYAEHVTASENVPPDQQLASAMLLQDCHAPLLWPLSWGAGIYAAAICPLINNTITTILPSTMPSPMTAEYAKEVMRLVPRGPKNCLLTVPGTLQELAKEPAALEAFKNYDWVGYGGAPLDYDVGDLITKHTRVQSMMGATECGMHPLLLDEPEDWKYHRFHLNLHGWHLAPFQDDLYELCIRRAEKNEWRAAFTMNEDPNLQVYHTKDLCRPVPGREGFWEMCGRTDDFVKLSSLTKFNGINIEQIIDRHPDVKACLVAGEGKVKPFVLVQPSSQVEALHLPPEEVVERVWPAIEAAIKALIEEAKLVKQLVLVTKNDQPISRLAKGTIDRRSTLKVYEKRIEDMYKTQGLNYAAPHPNGGVSGHANGDTL